jgi:hypothetical protein
MNAAETVPLRRTLYAVLIAVVAGMLGGRILSVDRVYEPDLFRASAPPAGDEGRFGPYSARRPWPATRPEPMPTFGSNDRARWATIRALVDQGTYAVGHRETDPETGKYRDTGIVTEDGWQTIDKVLRPDTQDFYASKPPLLSTLLAGEYWLLKKAFGWEISGERGRWLVMRATLLTVNWLPILIYLGLLARLVDRLGATDWGRLYVMAAACFGTFLNTFAVSLNNHTVAACSAVFALYPVFPLLRGSAPKGEPVGYGRLVVSGFFAAFTACNELPALAFLVALGAILLLRAPRRTLLAFVPAAALPLAAFLLTNYAAIHQWSPAYFEFGGPWYEYPGSHWEKPAPGQTKYGIDWARDKESHATYVFHCLVGHHGLFSLTPVWLLAVTGMGVLLVRRNSRDGPAAEPGGRLLGALTLYLTVVVVGFYLFFVSSRNYGGSTSNLRWLMWLSPFWLLAMTPVADALAARRWGRGLAGVLLAVSVLSVSYPAWNPWRHPWLYNWLEALGWVQY